MQKKWGKAGLALLAFVLAGTFYCVEMYKQEAPMWESVGVDKTAEPEMAEENGNFEPQQSEQRGETQSEQNGETATNETTIAEKTIYVHICGAVQKPGVYEVPDNYRLYELLDLAGGATDEDCADALNLAESLQDGQRIVIPTASEAQTMQAT
ncbi:MAG: SLBB domain-containing protein, partial [Lachnospiraceae bacterium]|nr:SLBB domain-containing protein [Lachnospiraceae bacterium]